MTSNKTVVTWERARNAFPDQMEENPWWSGRYSIHVEIPSVGRWIAADYGNNTMLNKLLDDDDTLAQLTADYVYTLHADVTDEENKIRKDLLANYLDTRFVGLNALQYLEPEEDNCDIEFAE